MSSLTAKLSQIYRPRQAHWLARELNKIISGLSPCQITKNHITARDIALTAYADSIVDGQNRMPPLTVLSDFIQRYQLNRVFPILHLLPFYPWDIDRGFSIKDYRQVHPAYGHWGDIKRLSRWVRLMFDFVINHVSVDNPLAQASLIERHLDSRDPRYKQVNAYRDFVIAYSDQDKPTAEQLSRLVRPRPYPALTRYAVIENKDQSLSAVLGSAAPGAQIIGQGWVWTTFSRAPQADGTENTHQVDINFANPRVLLEAIKIILFYVQHEAAFIRLDAIAYIWKSLGRSCIHEPKAHQILAIIDHVLSKVAPHVFTVAEVNEPPDKILPYLGTARNHESDLVYQFASFPLAIHAVAFGRAVFYRQWLATTNDFAGRQFITVLGSHDGMGLKPIRGILPDVEISRLIELLVEKHQAQPNYAHLPGGRPIVYELCATPWHLVNQPDSREPFSRQLQRYRAVLSLGLVSRGIPVIYINGLLGAKNYLPPAGLDESRTVNRQVFDYQKLCDQLDNPASHHRQTMQAVTNLLKQRAAEPAFAPDGQPLQIFDPQNDAVVAALLAAPAEPTDVLALINVSSRKEKIELNWPPQQLRDILTDDKFEAKEGRLSLTLNPYQTLWLKKLPAN